jgi:hypothetical protein
MINEKLLFVTKGGEDCDNGFPYVLDLAKVLNTGIVMLLVYDKQTMDSYEDTMAAVAFAEAGESKTAKELMQEQEKKVRNAVDGKIKELAGRCKENSVPFMSHISVNDTVTAIKNFLKDKPYIDMILLSPNLSVSKKGIDLKKLLKNITKPIVTISRPAEAGA